MEAYGDGDARAFRELFDRLAPRVHAFFMRSFRRASSAEDLTQQTFLRLHRSRASYDRGRPLRPWLFTIAASVRRDELRRVYRVPALVNEDELERVEAPSDADLPGDESDEVEAVRAALDALPETQRVVLHLHRYEEMSLDEIAGVLGTTPGAVRVRASRAYAKLRDDVAERLGRQGAA